jgi:Putative prokaryotic signal transducing protein
MKKDILDDDWEWENDDDLEETQDLEDDIEVVMIKTFNSENQAHIYAAALNNEGINAQVVGNITGVMTPFDYGNVRLYVAESQSQEALNIIKQLDAENALKEKPLLSAAAILAIIIVGIFVIGALIYIVRMFFTSANSN